MENLHGQPSRPGLRDIMSASGPLPETQMPLHEQRGVIEAAIGTGLKQAFTKHGEFVEKDEIGWEKLTLKVHHDRGPAQAEIRRYTDTEGNITAEMSFGSKGAYENQWMYVEGPDGRRMIPCSRDESTGRLIPKKAPEDKTKYDPTSDSEVIWWSKPWVRNLVEGTPKKRGSHTLKRLLGRSALARR